MEAVNVTRLVYPGAQVSGIARIKAVKVERAPPNHNLETVRVPNLLHYESGCRLHADCFGHYCVTPAGILLPPQSMSMRHGDIATEYTKASRFAFENRLEEYKRSLESTNLTKDGTMRCIMSTPVSGSARLIATPNWYRRDVVWISQGLANKINTCYVDINDDGVTEPVYKERKLQEGDYVMFSRPPPLNIWNTQPMKIRFWNNNCIGVHPETFSAFHGDFDGDEAHIIPLYSRGSLQECAQWETPANEKFDEGRREYAKTHPEEWTDEDYWHRCKFMNTTTVSSKQMYDNAVRVKYGNISRNKDSNLNAMHNRFQDLFTEHDFVQQSIRGMKDVCKQQLSQGLIGDMTRTAKIAAMCFTRPRTGGLYVNTVTGPQLLCNDNLTDNGVPAVRAIMSFCEVAQQAALDSHRVQESSMASHDFISDVMLGKPVLEPKGEKLPTLILLDSSCPEHLVYGLKPVWKYLQDDSFVLLCKIQHMDSDTYPYLIGTYDPIVLGRVRNCNLSAQQLCFKALTVVCNYYKLRLTYVELLDMSYLLSFRASKCPDRITTRNGMLLRNLAWVETLEGTNATKIQSLKTEWQKPFSSTSSMFTANFSRMASGDTI